MQVGEIAAPRGEEEQRGDHCCDRQEAQCIEQTDRIGDPSGRDRSRREAEEVMRERQVSRRGLLLADKAQGSFMSSFPISAVPPPNLVAADAPRSVASAKLTPAARPHNLNHAAQSRAGPKEAEYSGPAQR